MEAKEPSTKQGYVGIETIEKTDLRSSSGLVKKVIILTMIGLLAPDFSDCVRNCIDNVKDCIYTISRYDIKDYFLQKGKPLY